MNVAVMTVFINATGACTDTVQSTMLFTPTVNNILRDYEMLLDEFISNDYIFRHGPLPLSMEGINPIEGL